MPQDQFYGFPKHGMEPQEWHPRFSQNAAGTFSPNKDQLALRKPYDIGTIVVIGQMVFAQATVQFDVAGSGGSVLLFLELPYQLQPSSRVGQGTLIDLANIGTFYYERSTGSALYTGITEGFFGTNQGIFRTGSGTTASGFGNFPSLAVAAGDIISVNLTYFANV